MKTKKIELTNWKTKDISSCVFHKKNNTFSIENNNNLVIKLLTVNMLKFFKKYLYLILYFLQTSLSI